MFKIKILFVSLGCLLGNLAYAGGDVLVSTCSNDLLRKEIIAKAQAEIGFQETLGANDGPRIREYRKSIPGINYPVPWCAIFCKWVYTQLNVDTPGNAWVPSWSAKPQYVIYYRKNARNELPCAGDAVTFYYPAMKREAHIAIVYEWPIEGDYFYTIEGNTNQAGGREGNSVRKKMRRKSDAYKIMRFV